MNTDIESCCECDRPAVTEGPNGEPYCRYHAEEFGAPLDIEPGLWTSGGENNSQ